MKKIIGVDEAGRGCLAGPVVAAVAFFDSNFDIFSIVPNLDDSKRMSPKSRENAFENIKRCISVEWAVGSASQKEIDKINILQATKLAMIRAIEKINYKESLLVIDGNFLVGEYLNQNSVIHGDRIVPQCSLASVIAKVTRDRIMIRYGNKYPQYGFSKNKGYGTKFHREAIKKYGTCNLHRKTFRLLD